MLLTLVVAAFLGGSTHLAITKAVGAEPTRCAEFAADSDRRAKQVTGEGQRVVVIGDSWSAGLGLDHPGQAWPSRLSGRVHVAGFSGSGFSALASPCGPVSFAARASVALADGADLIVVEGGLNDSDRTDAEIKEGFDALVRALGPDVAPVVIVGPATAPARSAQVPRVDALLAHLSAGAGYGYVSTADLELAYLKDGLHLTPAGHISFGNAVADRIVGKATSIRSPQGA